MRMPFDTGFVITSPYGYRVDPVTSETNSWHGGVDLVGNDRNVRSVMPGYVLRSRIVTDQSDTTSEWGNYVCVMNDDGRMCYYCHLASRAVEQLERVNAGQLLGIEGATGKVTGMHLHFEVRSPSGVQIDPCAYLSIPNRVGYEYDPPEPWETQASSWAVDGVRWAIENGILRGDGNGNYRLRDNLTREEMCVLLWRTVGNGV